MIRLRHLFGGEVGNRFKVNKLSYSRKQNVTQDTCHVARADTQTYNEQSKELYRIRLSLFVEKPTPRRRRNPQALHLQLVIPNTVRRRNEKSRPLTLTLCLPYETFVCRNKAEVQPLWTVQ